MYASRMCPIWPLHLIILYLLVLCPLWVLCQAAPDLLATFTADTFEMHMDDKYKVYVNVTGADDLRAGDEFTVGTDLPNVATAKWNTSYQISNEQLDKGVFDGSMWVNCHFLGRTDLTVEVRRNGDSFPIRNGTVRVTVIRPVRAIDTVFTTSVAVFVSLIFINFGCAMHWPTVKACFKKPIGPAIGLAGQYLFMPLISFGLGFLIFPDSPALRLGMFFSGVSPAGGASNIWTFILGGNLDLSLAMTSISTLAAFGLMPAWLFSLGQVVFANANIVVPYLRIGMFVIGLFIPLAIGLAMQRLTPKISAFMVRILKGFSTLLLLFIITFAIVTNVYIFQLMTWQILVAGMGVPWLGYLAGYSAARLFRQPHRDALAISIESGIQNTGIAIFLLRYALPQPEADITTVVPVSIAIMTPGPMICIYIYQRVKACRFLILKRMYKQRFSQARLERIDRMIEAANATCYSKLANCVIDLKKQDTKEVKKKRGWSESEWKKHMDYISQIAGPRREFTPPPVKRGPRKPLELLLPRINQNCQLPEFKWYRRLSKEAWYRDPVKVPPNALKYQITDRVKKLATPRAIPQAE